MISRLIHRQRLFLHWKPGLAGLSHWSHSTHLYPVPRNHPPEHVLCRASSLAIDSHVCGRFTRYYPISPTGPTGPTIAGLLAFRKSIGVLFFLSSCVKVRLTRYRPTRPKSPTSPTIAGPQAIRKSIRPIRPIGLICLWRYPAAETSPA